MRRTGVKHTAYALSNAVARENLAAGNPKFHAGETPLEQEAALKVIEPTNEQQLKELMKMIDLMYEEAGPQQRKALDFYKGQMAVDGATNAVKMRFLRRFYFWLLGRGTNDDHAKTLWGRGNVAVYNAEVAAYIEQFVEKRLQYALQLSLLAQRIPVSLNGYYLYFKYIVNGELRRAKGTDNIEFWDLSNDDFLKDFEVLAQYFDVNNNGKHGYADLIEPAATRPDNAAPFGAKGTPFVGVRGSTEPYPAGHENDGEVPGDEDDENKMHLENNRNFLAKAASGIAKTYGFAGSDRRQPPPETPAVAAKGKEEVAVVIDEEDDGTEDAEDVAAVTGGNKQQIEELSRTLQEATKREITASTAAAHESLLQKLEQHKDVAHIRSQLDELKKMSTKSTKKLEKQLTKSDLADLNEGIREIRVNVAAVQRGGGDDGKLEQTNKMLQNLEAQRDKALQEKQKLEGHTAELHKRLQEAQEESARKALVDGKHVAKIDELKRKLDDAGADKIKLQHELQEAVHKAQKDAEAAAQKHATAPLESEMRNRETARLQQELQETRLAMQKEHAVWKTELEQAQAAKTFAEEQQGKTETQLLQTQMEVANMKTGATQVKDAYELLTVQNQQQYELQVEELKAQFHKQLEDKVEAEKQRIREEGKAQFEAQVAQETAKQTAALQTQIAALQMLAQEVGGTVAGFIVNKVQETLSNKNASDASANVAARTAQTAAQQVAERSVIDAADVTRARKTFEGEFERTMAFINSNTELGFNEKVQRTTALNGLMRDFLDVYDKTMVTGLDMQQAKTLLKQYEERIASRVKPLLSK